MFVIYNTTRNLERLIFLAITLLYKIMQLFVFMVFGFGLARLKVVKSADSTALSKISLYLLMPSAIINAFDFKITLEIAKGIGLAFAAAIMLHIVYFLLDKLCLKTLRPNSVERASVMYSNAGNLIIPIVTFVLGEEWVLYSTAFLSVQLVFLWTHGIKIFAPNERLNIKKILLNINIIAIAVGVCLMLFGLKLPAFAKDIVSSLGGMIGTVGMLIAGIVAASLDFKKVFRNKRLYKTAFLRMIIYPIISLFILKLFSFIGIQNSDKILLITFLAAMTPTAATVMQFAQIKGKDADYATAINIVTTIICIATMPLFVALYNFI